jgi:hypothetical protein
MAAAETYTCESLTAAWQEISPARPLDDGLRVLLLMYLNRTNHPRNEGRRGAAGAEKKEVSSSEIRLWIPPPQRFARKMRTSAFVPTGPLKALSISTPAHDREWKENLQTAPEGPTENCNRLNSVAEIDLTFTAINK